ncbi:unnamed protein product [Closterium sp. NIES-54]
MATPTVLTFDAEGRPIKFDVWLDDLHLYLQITAKDDVSLYDHTSGAALAPPTTADSTARSQWQTRDAHARLAVRSHLPLDEREHKTAKELYDVVVARYSSPATATIGRLSLPYLFPDLSAFATVADLITHLRTSDLRYRAALPPDFLAKIPPPVYLTLYHLITRLPDSLRTVRDQFLALSPTDLTVDLLEKELLAAEKSIVAVGASRGDPRTPFFEGCSPSPLLPSIASAAAVGYLGAEGWHDTLRTTLAALGFTPCTADPSLFLRTDTLLPPFYILVSSAQATPLAIGHSLSALPSDESVEPSGPYPELVGCLMYLMTCTRPDLAYPLGLLARYVAPGRHRRVHWDAAKRVLRYLCSTSGMGLVLGRGSPVVLNGHSDASWVDDQATQGSSQGYTFSLGSGSVSWRSMRLSSVLSSSCEAEIYATAVAAQELRWLTYLLTDLGERPRSPPVLYVDNKAAIALCEEHRLEHRTKHISLRYFLARELQQRGQLRLRFVASQANTADIFTKALQSGDHQRFCTLLGLVPTFPHLL